jgi:hypothetical protein
MANNEEEKKITSDKEDADEETGNEGGNANEDGSEDAEDEEGGEEKGNADSSKIDYEDELKKERERGRQEGFAEAEFKRRENKRKKKPEDASEDEDKEDVDEEDEDKPLTAKQVRELLERDRQQTRKELQSGAIRDIAGRLTKNPHERDLIIEIHKNRIFPEGLSLEEQLDEAQAIANRKRVKAQTDELKRSLQGKNGKNDNPAVTRRDAPITSEPKISAKDVQSMKAQGFVWDGALKIYKKPIGNNKFYFFNPKTKQRGTM